MESAEGRPGVATACLPCPSCDAGLSVIRAPGLLRFRCRRGHAFEAADLVAEWSRELDEVLELALHSCEEQSALLRELAEISRGQGCDRAAAVFDQDAAWMEERARRLREHLRSV